MPSLLDHVDPDGLLEYSVVFTDRSLNHMSARFAQVMRDISATLKEVYNADETAVMQGGGTFAMEAAARQFGDGKRVMTIRNGWFAYRFAQIFEAGGFAESHEALHGRRSGNHPQSPFVPHPIEDAVRAIGERQPDVVFATHVGTSAGMIMGKDYIAALAEAVHTYGGLLVMDCIASGCVWLDMKALGIDVLISATQKSWSGTPGAGLIALNERAAKLAVGRPSSSFSLDLGKRIEVMRSYETGGSVYYTTMPTDGLVMLRDAMAEMRGIGFDVLEERQWELGRRVRTVLKERGFRSVAAEEVAAPGVVVCFTGDAAYQSGKAFAAAGIQTAPGIGLALDEGPDYRSFRVGLFGIDKLMDIDGTVARFEHALDLLRDGAGAEKRTDAA